MRHCALTEDAHVVAGRKHDLGVLDKEQVVAERHVEAERRLQRQHGARQLGGAQRLHQLGAGVHDGGRVGLSFGRDGAAVARFRHVGERLRRCRGRTRLNRRPKRSPLPDNGRIGLGKRDCVVQSQEALFPISESQLKQRFDPMRGEELEMWGFDWCQARGNPPQRVFNQLLLSAIVLRWPVQRRRLASALPHRLSGEQRARCIVWRRRAWRWDRVRGGSRALRTGREPVRRRTAGPEVGGGASGAWAVGAE